MVRKMKDSGVEWIGEIPEDWEVSRLKYHFQIIAGSGFPITMQGKEKGDYPVCKASDIAKSNGTLQYAANYLDANEINGFNIVPKDSIIMPKIGEAMKKNSRALVLCDVLIDNNCQGIVPKDFHFKFAYNLFKIIDMNWFDNSGTIPSVNNRNLLDSSIPKPDYNKQTRISAAIDSKFQELNFVADIINKEIHTLEAYKKSVITEAVTKGLDKNVEMKDSGIEWIGEIPKHWHLVKLKFLTETIAKGISPNYTEEELSPVVNQATFSKGYFDYNLKFCRDELKGDGLLKKNDVLLATTGGGVLGKTFYFQEEDKYLASTDVAYLRFKSEDVSKFIYYVLSVNYDLLNGEFAKGSTNQTHLQMDRLSNMEIPWPGEDELKQILTKVDYSVLSIDEVIAIKQNQLSLLDEYKKSLIYEYVTGKREV